MPVIDRFEGEHEFLSNFFPCEISFEGKKYPTCVAGREDFVVRFYDKKTSTWKKP